MRGGRTGPAPPSEAQPKSQIPPGSRSAPPSSARASNLPEEIPSQPPLSKPLSAVDYGSEDAGALNGVWKMEPGLPRWYLWLLMTMGFVFQADEAASNDLLGEVDVFGTP